MTRKGSGVRGATIAKAAPQVIVGCGYLADVIISPSGGRAVLFKSGEGDIQLSNICGETGKTQTKLPNSTKES